jgi:tetratricopeptide (TPR) repeat protein
MRLWFAILFACALGLAPPARADEERDLRARQLYELGRKAYNDGDYQAAYDNFKESFSLSHKAALLYNVASALQQLKRPHDAAETLRSYLRLRPDDSERAQIDERIKALDEEQRLLDIDRAQNPQTTTTTPTTTPTPTTIDRTDTVVMPMSEPPVTAPPAIATTRADDGERARRRKRNVTIAVTVGSIAVVGLAVGLGLGLGLSGGTDALTKSTVGPIAGTR